MQLCSYLSHKQKVTCGFLLLHLLLSPEAHAFTLQVTQRYLEQDDKIVIAKKRSKQEDDAYRACRARVHIGPNVHFGPNVYICGRRVS